MFFLNFYNFCTFFVFHLVAVKSEDILNDDASHFKLARSVLKIASFEFTNLQYFNSAFMNFKIVNLVLNLRCEIVVHTVFNVSDCLDSDKHNVVHFIASIYMFTSNEEISKIEKTYL